MRALTEARRDELACGLLGWQVRVAWPSKPFPALLPSAGVQPKASTSWAHPVWPSGENATLPVRSPADFKL